jgi:hypothetical protein
MLTRLRLSSSASEGWGRGSTLAVAVAGAIVVVVFAIGDSSFESAFLSNFLSTVAGVAVGVPVAIWLAFRESTAQAAAAAKQATETARNRRRQVLTAIETELKENKNTLAERRSSGPREFAIPFLQDEVWTAMSDGGELRWIEDPALIRQIARSYLYVKTIDHLERKVFDLMHTPSVGIAVKTQQPLHRSIIEKIVGYLDHQDGVAMAAIDEGLAAIHASHGVVTS